MFSPDGTLISASAAPHCGVQDDEAEHLICRELSYESRVQWTILEHTRDRKRCCDAAIRCSRQQSGAINNADENTTTTRIPVLLYTAAFFEFQAQRSGLSRGSFDGEREKKSVNQDSTRRRTIVQFREKSQLQKRQSCFGSGERLARSLHNPTSLSIS